MAHAYRSFSTVRNVSLGCLCLNDNQHLFDMCMSLFTFGAKNCLDNINHFSFGFGILSGGTATNKLDQFALFLVC